MTNPTIRPPAAQAMDAAFEARLRAGMCSALQVSPAKLRIEKDLEGGWRLFMPDHAFPLACAVLEETGRAGAKVLVRVEPSNGHPVEGEEGLFHHSMRDAWLADEKAAHEAASLKGGGHAHPASVALREALARPVGVGVGRIRFEI